MTDNLCSSCANWRVHWDMHSECKAGVEKPDTYRSCKLGCPKYKFIERKKGESK